MEMLSKYKQDSLESNNYCSNVMQSPIMQTMVAPGNVFYRLSNKDRPQEYDKNQSAIEKLNSNCNMRNENSFNYCNMYYGKIDKVLDGQNIVRSEFDSVKPNDLFISSSSEISSAEQNNFFKEKTLKGGSVDDHEKNNSFFPDHSSCDNQCKTKLADHLKHQVIECDSSLKHLKPENFFHLTRYERSRCLSTYSYQNKPYLVNESLESQNLCLKNDLQNLKWNPHTYTSPPKGMVNCSRESRIFEKSGMDEHTVIHKLLRNGRCVWPSCEQIFSSRSDFIRHLDCHHVLDEKGAAQARVQGYVVRELEEKLSYERSKLTAMLTHLQFTNEKGSVLLQKTAHNLSPPPGRHSVQVSSQPSTSNGSGQCVMVSYPPPGPRSHPGPFDHPTDNEHLTSPLHPYTRDGFGSPSPSTSPRRFSSHNTGSHNNFIPHHKSQGTYHPPPPRYYPALHPYPLPPKRESPNEIDRRSPKKEHITSPGLMGMNHERHSSEMHRSMIEGHTTGSSHMQQHIMKMNSTHDSSYHPVRRRGEAAAMVDIGQELRAKGKLFEDPDVRPPYTYASLIRQGVMDSPNGELTLNEIYNWFMKNFAYFRKNTSTWKNAVRHNLSLHKCFVRKENFKGAVWTVDDVEFFRRRMTKPGLPKRDYYMPGLQEETDSPPEPEDDYVADELPSMAMDGNQKHGDNGYSNSPKSNSEIGYEDSESINIKEEFTDEYRHRPASYERNSDDCSPDEITMVTAAPS